MPSERRITIYLEKEDFKLFKIALKKYKKDDSKLGREIMHMWLFNNKLQLEARK